MFGWVAPALFAEVPFDYPITAPPHAQVEAAFTKTNYTDSKSEGSKVTVRDRKGKALFERELTRDVASGARWTDDGQFLIITGVNGAGHQPWHFHVYIFSLTALAIRQLDDSDRPIVSSETWCQAPDIFILVGHTFEHKIPAPDDPVLIRYRASELWPKLKKI
jgi:hypothetical protein